jgi:hypothetical protein
MAARLDADRRSPPPDAMSVSEVTARVKEHLETRFADVWVAGEVSNLTRGTSTCRSRTTPPCSAA